MTNEEIELLFPEFDKWVHSIYLGFSEAKSTIRLWYQFLEGRK